jgi:hypothetical protein
MELDENLNVSSVEPVTESSLALGYTAGPWMTWLSGGVLGWLRPQALATETIVEGALPGGALPGGAAPSTELPRVDLWLAVGLGAHFEL